MSDDCLADTQSAKLEKEEENLAIANENEQITIQDVPNKSSSEIITDTVIISSQITEAVDTVFSNREGEDKEEINSITPVEENENEHSTTTTTTTETSSLILSERNNVQIGNELTTTNKSKLSLSQKNVPIDLNQESEYQYKNNIINTINNQSQNIKAHVAKNTYLSTINDNNTTTTTTTTNIITTSGRTISDPIKINQSTSITSYQDDGARRHYNNPIIECDDWSSSSSTRIKNAATNNEFSEEQIFPSYDDYTKTEWSCQTCTYINLGQEPMCFQCKSPFINNNIINNVTDIDSAFQPLKISELDKYSNYASGIEIGAGGGDGGTRNRIASEINLSPSFSGGRLYERSCTSSKPSSTLINNSLDWPISSPASCYEEKWPCLLCTFENWPAATKCVMCLSPRSREVFCESDGGGHNIQDTSNNNRDNIIVENNRLLSESYTVRLRHRKSRLESDTARWLEACRGAICGNSGPIEEFLARGGDPTRTLTASDVAILDRPSAFGVGYTLVHLALRFQHQDVLNMLLSHLDNGSSTVKRVPSYVAPDLDMDIRNHVMGTIRYGKGNFRCNYSTEIATFTLPSGIENLSPDTQETLYDEILDRDVQNELEAGKFINWSVELTEQLNSRLYALWNRSAGDCLLDSVLQATWGIFDKDNGLRQALANSLRDSASLFYQRWRENEILLSHMLDFSLNENQCAADWDNLLTISGQPGSSLEQLHIFALAHIFRRPIIVYSVKFVKSYLGETLGYARYEGVYLPFLWEASQCWKYPIALGYTRGHFSALVPHEPDSDPLSRLDCAAQLDGDGLNSRCTYLPLNTADGNLLPIHYLGRSEVGSEEHVLGQWLDICYTNSGILVARQRIQKRPLLVAQLIEEWLNHYRTLPLGGQVNAPYMRQSAATCYSSDGDSD